MSNITITPAKEENFEAIWAIFHPILQGQDTYAYKADMPKALAKDYWLGPDVTSYVASYDGEIAGVYALRTNRPGYASHVANASFIVNPAFHGRGIGRMMGKHCLETAKCKGFLAIQFNFVVSTNIIAVNLWKSLGFTIIGTIPQGFLHGKLGFVDALIMHRFL